MEKNTHKLLKLQLLIRKWMCMNGVVGWAEYIERMKEKKMRKKDEK